MTWVWPKRVWLLFGKHGVRVLVAIALTTAPTASARADETADRMARAVLDEFAAGSFDKVAARFTPQMTAALPGEAVAALWQRNLVVAGALRWVNDSIVVPANLLRRVELHCTFERSDAVVTFTFNPQDKLAGIGIRLAGPPSAARLPSWSAPDYVLPSAFEEREITLGERTPLGATLSMPTQGTQVPAVVIVGGSGPNDRDETVVPNRPMKDLAHGLASRGIAVLRYDKRTLVYPAQFQPQLGTTVKEEAIDDTIAAIVTLANTPRIDPTRIVVVGHSLGGLVAPRIAAADRRVAGLVVLAVRAEAFEGITALGPELSGEAANGAATVRADCSHVAPAHELSATVAVVGLVLARVVDRGGNDLDAELPQKTVDDLCALGVSAKLGAGHVVGWRLETAGVAGGSEEFLRLRQVELEVLRVRAKVTLLWV